MYAPSDGGSAGASPRKASRPRLANRSTFKSAGSELVACVLAVGSDGWEG
jgi:hypothetical protein